MDEAEKQERCGKGGTGGEQYRDMGVFLVFLLYMRRFHVVNPYFAGPLVGWTRVESEVQ